MSRATRRAGKTLRISIALLAGLVACGTTPFRGDTGIRPFAFDMWDVHCPSGLRVLFERAPGSQTAGVTFVVGAGSTEDPEGREGLAHLVEHLTFRARDSLKVPMRDRLWALGASYDAQTGFDETTFEAYVPAQSLPALLRLEGRWLVDPLHWVDQATFLVERDVVRNELREHNETHSFGAAYEAAYAAAFPAGHPYRRPVGGTHASLSALTLADASAFVARHYRPDNLTMVVVGDMDLPAVEAFVRGALPPELYGDPAYPRPIARPPIPTFTAPDVPPDAGLRRARAAVTTPELWIAWSLPGGNGRSEDLADMWSTLTLQNFWGGRLPDYDVAGVSLFASPGVRGSILICRVQLTEGLHPEESLRQVVAALPWIGGDEVYLDQRFGGLKLSRLRELAFDAEGIQSRSVRRVTYAHLTGSPSAYGELVEAVKAITADQARAFAETYLGAARARAVFVEPLAPDARPPAPIAAAADAATVIRHEPLSQETLRNLASVRRLGGLRTTALPNGLDVVVLPRAGAPVVTGVLAFHGDRLGAGTGLAGAANEALHWRFEESPSDFGILYRTEVDIDLVQSTVGAGAANVPRAFDMLQFGTRSLDVDWPSDKFRETRVPLMRRQEASPHDRGERAFWKALFGDHPFAAWPLVDQIAARKSGEIETWLEHIVTPANGVLVVVGDVDPATVEAAARDSLTRLPGAGPALPAPPAVAPTPTKAGIAVLDSAGGVIITHRPGATQAELHLGCLLEPTGASRAAADALMADIVQSSLEGDLRQQTGSTYGVHTWISRLRGGTAIFNLEANIDNGRLRLAVSTLRRFWKRYTTEGASADFLRNARDTSTTNLLLSYDTSRALAHRLVELWNQGWPLASLDEAAADIAATTDGQVNAALRTCGDNLVVAVTGDERTIRAAFVAPPKEIPKAAPKVSPPAPPPAPAAPPPAPPAPPAPAAPPPAPPAPAAPRPAPPAPSAPP